MTATQPVCAFSQGREVIHEDLLWHFRLSQLYHCVWRAEHRPTLTITADLTVIYELANLWRFVSPITVSEEVRRSLICLRMSWFAPCDRANLQHSWNGVWQLKHVQLSQTSNSRFYQSVWMSERWLCRAAVLQISCRKKWMSEVNLAVFLHFIAACSTLVSTDC